MTKLITVHGTGSGLDEDRGARWWQHDSPFTEELEQLLDLGEVEIVPFHWGQGSNSEEARRQAGKDLYDMLDGLDESGEDYALIGHSHGGMVIYNALLVSSQKRDPLKRLLAWTTIGCPFLDVRPKRFLIQRLDPPGLAVLLLVLAQVLVASSLFIGHLTGADLTRSLDVRLGETALRDFYLPLQIGSIVLAGLGYGLLALYEWWRHGWFATSVKCRVVELYAHNWVGFYHDDDEAISALRTATVFKPKVVPRSILSQLFATLPVLAFVVALVSFVVWLEIELSDPAGNSWVKPWIETFVAGLPTHLSSIPSLTAQLEWLVILAVVFVALSSIVYVFREIGSVLGVPVSSWLDRIIRKALREQIWGDDLGAEYVHAVAAQPPVFPPAFAPLSGLVASEISAISDASASATLQKLRSRLGLSGLGDGQSSQIDGALSQLSWHELIHTTYFDAPLFVRMLALAQHRFGVAGLRRQAWMPEERGRVRDALAALEIGSRRASSDRVTVDGGRTGLVTGGLNLSVTQKAVISLAAIAGALAVGVFLTALATSLEIAVALWVGGGGLTLLLAELQPVSVRGLTPAPGSPLGFEQAIRRLEELSREPEATIHPRCEAHVLHHGMRMPYSCVLVHGISNCPYSMVDFAPRLHALGCNVLVARLPYNGHLDNGTDALRYVTAENLRVFADQCVDIAAGLGDHVTVLGISAGGVVTGWMAQNRREVDHAILIAPAFGLSSFGVGFNTALMRLALVLPNFSVWKDPVRRANAASRPHSYKRQATHGIGEVMRLGLAVLEQARRTRPAAAHITVVTNGADAAVDPQMTNRIVGQWRGHGASLSGFEFPSDLALPHELIDPTEENANPGVVYPRLISIIAEQMKA